MSLFRQKSSLPRLKPLSNKRPTIVTVLDIGSSKTVCFIGRLTPLSDSEVLAHRTHKVEIIGIGHQKSRGVKAGVIMDIEQVENSVRSAVDTAERMAGVTVDSLIINVTAGRLKSEIFTASIDLGGEEVAHSDLTKVVNLVTKRTLSHERSILHSLPTSYALDGERGIIDPEGMYGDKLGVDLHVLSADRAPLKNLEMCVNRGHLTVEAMVATPYASGLASLVADEAEMGCACVDLGGGTTTISVFNEGKFIFADAVALGGHHVTMDLARGLTTRFDDAERIKVMHGSSLPSACDDKDVISIPPIGDEMGDHSAQVSKAMVARIVRARVEETLELVRDRIQQSGYAPIVGKRVILTGGASQLTGLADSARRILARNVRIGRPLGVSGLPAAVKGPAFSAASGLMIYPQVANIEAHGSERTMMAAANGTGGRLAQMGQWFKESF